MNHSCSVFSCENQKIITSHRFPNPDKDLERFELWLDICNNPKFDGIPKDKIYRNYTVCEKHFLPEHKTRNGKLLRNAVPMLCLSDSERSKVDGKSLSGVSRYCAVMYCPNQVVCTSIASHRFPYPSETERFDSWLAACKNPNLEKLSKEKIFSTYRVCNVHFLPEHQNIHKILLKNAVPQLLLPNSKSMVSNTTSKGPSSLPHTIDLDNLPDREHTTFQVQKVPDKSKVDLKAIKEIMTQDVSEKLVQPVKAQIYADQKIEARSSEEELKIYMEKRKKLDYILDSLSIDDEFRIGTITENYYSSVVNKNPEKNLKLKKKVKPKIIRDYENPALIKTNPEISSEVVDNLEDQILINSDLESKVIEDKEVNEESVLVMEVPDSSLLITPKNIRKSRIVCRTCLNEVEKGGYVTLGSKSEEGSVWEKLVYAFEVDLFEDNGVVCIPCVSFINQGYKFKKNFNLIQLTLKKRSKILGRKAFVSDILDTIDPFKWKLENQNIEIDLESSIDNIHNLKNDNVQNRNHADVNLEDILKQQENVRSQLIESVSKLKDIKEKQEKLESEKTLLCQFCGEKYLNRRRYHKHEDRCIGLIRSKKEEEPPLKKNKEFEDIPVDHSYSCPYCEGILFSKEMLESHINEGHLSNYDNQCPLCKIGFQTRDLLMKHIGKCKGRLKTIPSNQKEDKSKIPNTTMHLKSFAQVKINKNHEAKLEKREKDLESKKVIVQDYASFQYILDDNIFQKSSN